VTNVSLRVEVGERILILGDTSEVCTARESKQLTHCRPECARLDRAAPPTADSQGRAMAFHAEETMRLDVIDGELASQGHFRSGVFLTASCAAASRRRSQGPEPGVCAPSNSIDFMAILD
jgi:hypothetical protein